MTKQQEQDRMDRLNDIGVRVKALLYDYCFEDDKAAKHLERVKAHLDEAWIDADGQKARSVDELVGDIELAENLFRAVAKAKAGDEFEIGGRTFVKQPEGISRG